MEWDESVCWPFGKGQFKGALGEGGEAARRTRRGRERNSVAQEERPEPWATTGAAAEGARRGTKASTWRTPEHRAWTFLQPNDWAFSCWHEPAGAKRPVAGE